MKDVVWVYLVCGFLAIVIIAGGSSLLDHAQFLVFSWLGMALLVAALWRLRRLSVDRLTVFAVTVLFAAIALMFVQLLPLPQSLWSVMGGRGFIVESLNATQQSETWLALSLSPEATKQNILAIVPAVAVFIALLSVPREHHGLIAMTVIGLAMFGLLLSLLQTGTTAVTGGFINPNFFAAQLYMSIPFAIACAWRFQQRSIWTIAVGFIVLSLAAIGQSGSRLGLLLGFGTIIASVLIVWRGLRNPAGYGLVAFGGIMVIALLFGGASLERLTGLQTALAARGQMFSTSLQALFSFLPAGSGFGSFVPVYQLFEPPATVSLKYVNHAHNDWVELFIEGGLAMAAVLGAFLRWFTFSARNVFSGHSAIGKAAAISAIAVLLHSFADYPLRTPAVMVLFAVACGLMARASTYSSKSAMGSEPAFDDTRAVPA